MSDLDKTIKEALEGGSGFDPNRAQSAHAKVHQEYQRKLMWSERIMWLQVYLLLIAAGYAAGGFAVQATTTKGWVGYGVVFLVAMVIIIQKTILYGLSATQLVAMKEIKQLRLAVTGEAAPRDDAAARPLRGLRPWEKAAWLIGVLVTAIAAAQVGTRSNRQDDLWRLKAGNQVEAHSVLTLRRFPHEIPSLWSIKEPADGATLESASLNGQPISIDKFNARQISGIQLPYRVSWKTDKIELVWSFSLPAMNDYGSFRARLRSLIPVHNYSLLLYIEDDSGLEAIADAWKFNKTPAELKDEAEARRTLKCFTGGAGDVARDDFGTCGLPIRPRPAP